MIQRQHCTIMLLTNALSIAATNNGPCRVHHIDVMTNDRHGAIDNLLRECVVENHHFRS